MQYGTYHVAIFNDILSIYHAALVFLLICLKYKINKTKTQRPRAQGCFGNFNNKRCIICANVIPVFTEVREK